MSDPRTPKLGGIIIIKIVRVLDVAGGRETDILAVFEIEKAIFRTKKDEHLEWARRFAIHVEVKHPGDNFKDDPDEYQAERYVFRPQCWVAKKPKKVLAHADATTVPLCSDTRLKDYGDDPGFFDKVITFEEIVEAFPNDPAFLIYQNGV
jgi:hypothetical protein